MTEDEIRIQMTAFAKVENARARKIWGGSSRFTQEQSKLNGQKGGRPTHRPKAQPKKKVAPLDGKTQVINRMFLRGWETDDIADVLGVDVKVILDAKLRYGLPREEA